MNENTECLYVREKLFDYANHELTPDDYERISEHLKFCRACRLESDEITGITNALPEALPVPVKRIRAGVDFMIRADQRKKKLRSRILRCGSMAAAFCVVAGLAFWCGRLGMKSQAWLNCLNGNYCSGSNFRYDDQKKNGSTAGDALAEEEIQVTIDRNDSMSDIKPGLTSQPQVFFVGSNLSDVMHELDADAIECGSMKCYVLNPDLEEHLSECIVRYQKELLYYEVTQNTKLSDNSFIGEEEEEEIRAALDRGMIVVLDIGS